MISKALGIIKKSNRKNFLRVMHTQSTSLLRLQCLSKPKTIDANEIAWANLALLNVLHITRLKKLELQGILCNCYTYYMGFWIEEVILLSYWCWPSQDIGMFIWADQHLSRALWFTITASPPTAIPCPCIHFTSWNGLMRPLSFSLSLKKAILVTQVICSASEAATNLKVYLLHT